MAELGWNYCRERRPFVPIPRAETFEDSLRSDSRFKDLLRRMNFPP